MYPTDASEALSSTSSIRADAQSLEETIDDYSVVSRPEKGGAEGPLSRCSTHPDNTSPLSTRGASGQTGLPQDRPASGQDRPASGQTGKSRADLEAIVELIKEHGLSSGGGGFTCEGRRAIFVLGNTGAPP